MGLRIMVMAVIPVIITVSQGCWGDNSAVQA